MSPRESSAALILVLSMASMAVLADSSPQSPKIDSSSATSQNCAIVVGGVASQQLDNFMARKVQDEIHRAAVNGIYESLASNKYKVILMPVSESEVPFFSNLLGQKLGLYGCDRVVELELLMSRVDGTNYEHFNLMFMHLIPTGGASTTPGSTLMKTVQEYSKEYQYKVTEDWMKTFEPYTFGAMTLYPDLASSGVLDSIK